MHNAFSNFLTYITTFTVTTKYKNIVKFNHINMKSEPQAKLCTKIISE